MKQVFVRNGRIIIEEVPPPALHEGYVLVANEFSVISSGTERATIQKSSEISTSSIPRLMKKAIKKVFEQGITKTVETAREYLQTTGTLGYSSAGYILEVGRKITDLNVGDRVACAGAGKANHAEIVSVPRNLVAKVPERVSLRDAAFTTLGAIAIQAIRRANLQFGETVMRSSEIELK